MRRAKLPLDERAIEKANQALSGETGGRSLGMGPEDAPLRKKWMDAYIEAAGPDSYVETSEERKKTPVPIQPCPFNEKDNFVELKYSYCNGDGVAGASYNVTDADTNSLIANGVLDDSGYSFVPLPLDAQNIRFRFYNDPVFVKFLKVPQSNKEQSKVEPGWEFRITESIKDGGSWIWGVVQGDFNEDPTFGQVLANMVITMIPVVDQAGDIRDIVANLKFLIYDERYDEAMVWFGLLVALIGCYPEAGSLLKGIIGEIKVAIKSGSKVPLQKLMAVLNGFAQANAVKYLRELSSKLPEYGSFAKSKLKEILNALISWLNKIISYLPDSIAVKATSTKGSAEKVLAEVDKRVDEVIEEISKKLDETLDESVDFSKEGNIKSINEEKQSAAELNNSLNGWRKKTDFGPKVKETAEAIEKRFGNGTVKDAEKKYKTNDGRAGDVDIELENIYIEVKTGRGKGSTTQSIKNDYHAKSNNKKYVLYAPDEEFSGFAERGLKEEGITVVRSEEELLKFIEENN